MSGEGREKPTPLGAGMGDKFTPLSGFEGRGGLNKTRSHCHAYLQLTIHILRFYSDGEVEPARRDH